MQTEAPDVFDIAREPEKLRARYGDSDFGRGCLMALRLVDKGVRMVQIYFGDGQPWDSHDDILVHKRLPATVDPAMGALIEDLKLRGLLDDTLVIVGGEFGRKPTRGGITIELPFRWCSPGGRQKGPGLWRQ